MSDILKLSFLTNRNDKITLNIPKASRNLDDADVKTAMQNIISSGALYINGATLSSGLGAELFEVTQTDFNV